MELVWVEVIVEAKGPAKDEGAVGLCIVEEVRGNNLIRWNSWRRDPLLLSAKEYCKDAEHFDSHVSFTPARRRLFETGNEGTGRDAIDGLYEIR